MSRFVGGFLRTRKRLGRLESKRCEGMLGAALLAYANGEKVPAALLPMVKRILATVEAMKATMPGPGDK